MVVALVGLVMSLALPALFGRVAGARFDEAGRRAVASSAVAAADARRRDRCAVLVLRYEGGEGPGDGIELVAIELSSDELRAAEAVRELLGAGAFEDGAELGTGFGDSGGLGAGGGAASEMAAAEFGVGVIDDERRERVLAAWPDGTLVFEMTAELTEARAAAGASVLEASEQMGPGSGMPGMSGVPGGGRGGFAGEFLSSSAIDALDGLLGVGDGTSRGFGFDGGGGGIRDGVVPDFARDSAAGIGGVDAGVQVPIALLTPGGATVAVREVALGPDDAASSPAFVVLAADVWGGGVSLRPLVEAGEAVGDTEDEEEEEAGGVVAPDLDADGGAGGLESDAAMPGGGSP